MVRSSELDQVDMGEEEIEDILDEEEDDTHGEGNVMEMGIKHEEIEVADEDDEEDIEDEEAQEGLDLDMPEEDDGMGIYHDEHDDEDPGFRENGRLGTFEKNNFAKSNGSIGYQSGPYTESVERNEEDVEDDNATGINTHDMSTRDVPLNSSERNGNEEIDQAPEFERDARHTEHANKEGGRCSLEEGTFTQEHESRDKIDENKEDPLARPPHGSEVFVGGITKEVLEDELRELCASCGELFEVRLMKDNEKGDNKGFAFVTYTNKEDAEKAIETLNGYDLKGRKLRFSSSQAKNKLFIGNVPKTWSKDEFQRVLLERGPGITNLELLMQLTGGRVFISAANSAF